MVKTEEYYYYKKVNKIFKRYNEIMPQIKAINPQYAKVATVSEWEALNRTKKENCKLFNVKIANNQKCWLLDVSQTTGKPLPQIYKKLSNNTKVPNFQAILDCLVRYSPQPVPVIMQSKLSENQLIFDLVREIIKYNQTSPLVVESASYMVCRHIGIDTSDFTFGYILKLLEFDEILTKLKDTILQDTITKETKVFIGYLDATLSSLQDSDLIYSDSAQQVQDSTEVAITHDIPDINSMYMGLIRKLTNVLPDETINIDKVRKYGYKDQKMIPIGDVAALRLFQEGREVYKLNKDDSEELIQSSEEISKHHGYFGISLEEWYSIQLQEFKKLEQLLTKANTKKVDNQIGKANKTNNTNSTEQNKKNKNNSQTLDNQKWLEVALPNFFKLTGYKYTDMPFFTRQERFEPSPEMLKINMLISHQCAKGITKILNHYKQHRQSHGQNTTYNIKQSVLDTCEYFSHRHILYALSDMFWLEIKVPQSVRIAFNNCYRDYYRKFLKSHGLQKSIKHQKSTKPEKPKKTNLEEQIRGLEAQERINNIQKSLDEINSQNQENLTIEQKGQQMQQMMEVEQVIKIHSIMNDYKALFTRPVLNKKKLLLQEF